MYASEKLESEMKVLRNGFWIRQRLLLAGGRRR
jgi:hypothetical protein